MTAAEVVQGFVVGEREASWQAFGMTLYKYNPFTMWRGKLQASISRMFRRGASPCVCEPSTLLYQETLGLLSKQKILIKEIWGIFILRTKALHLLRTDGFLLRLLGEDKKPGRSGSVLTQSAHMLFLMRKIINWKGSIIANCIQTSIEFPQIGKKLLI